MKSLLCETEILSTNTYIVGFTYGLASKVELSQGTHIGHSYIKHKTSHELDLQVFAIIGDVIYGGLLQEVAKFVLAIGKLSLLLDG